MSNLHLILTDIFRVVIHDWERPYYKEGAKSLGYVLETEVSIYACDEKNKKQTHLLCSTAIEIVIEITEKIIVNATPGERATPHRGSHPAPPIMKRGETSQLHLFMFRCGGRIPRSILMQLPRTLKVLVV